ncbi:putative bifunctional diguanylate cyclase/phosphodiesterase [Pseudoalteromonas obscura]|uniref:EAL domain-containing protein n=1 Tax=Pseudoalteromonas obscura TaxID=3048491 RepID=A0ABT7ESQ4_9GAMM|nr:EAL domain-containing protein [Pseudoalteromonas sp. P94(2023)]MDK2598086.1 EAL domain-containing protein [Pseudoalteromonas sp. P94(2023)]
MSRVKKWEKFFQSSIKFGGWIYSAYLCAICYMAVVFHEHYTQRSHHQLEQQVAQYQSRMSEQLQRFAHLLYSIEAYLRATPEITPEQFYHLAQSQLAGLELELSLESYAIIEGSQVEALERQYRDLGFFDFTVHLPETESKRYLTTVKAAPVSEFGHLLGSSVVISEASSGRLQKSELQAINWPDSHRWSVVIEQFQRDGLAKALGIGFQLQHLLEGLFSQFYQDNGHQVRVLSERQLLFTSDWQSSYGLAEIQPGIVETMDFFGQPIAIHLYTQEQLTPSLLNNYTLIIVMVVVIAAALGLMVLFQVRYLSRQHQTINTIVEERTASLAQANQQLQHASNKRLSSLQQQIVAERKYKSLFVNSSEGLFVLDKQGVLVDANPAFKTLLIGEGQRLNSLKLSDLMLEGEFAAKWRKMVTTFEQHEELEWLAGSEQCNGVWLRQTGSWICHSHDTIYEGRVTDITQIKLFNEQLKYKAQHDSLTDLLNRQTFLQLVEKSRQGDSGHFILLYIDLDRFKLINDTLGHLAGDTLLVEFAMRMRELVGSFADIARLGGDEFAILFEQTSLGEPLELLLEDILVAIREPFNYQGAKHSVSGSVGVRRFTAPCHNYEAEKLLHDADVAMYEAKKRGKNDYHIFTSAIASEASRRLLIERELQTLDMDKELSLRFQPIYCQLGETIIGFEALLRWHSPKLGIVSPAEFIPIAEECAQIVKLGHWVFQHAMQCAQRFPHRHIFMSVNVSPLQLQHKGFMHWLVEQFEVKGLNASQFKIELTESAMMTQENSLIAPLQKLYSMGFGIYIDDFGTGYSSLSRLNILPVDGLKIDRAFIDGIEKAGNPRQLIEAICAIAKSFNLTVTAEGIEQPAQLAVLSALYCQQTQGYLMSKPLLEEDALYLLQQNLQKHITEHAS